MQHRPSWRLSLFWLTLVLVVGPSITHAASTSPEAAGTQVKKSDVTGVKNFSRIGDAAGFGGATQPSATAALSKMGFASVINLRLATEPNVDVDGSRAAAEKAGLNYIHLPFDSANPDPQLVEKFLAVVKDPANQPPYIHCASANRVGVLWMIKRVLADDWEIGRAREEAQAIGMKGPQANLFDLKTLERTPRRPKSIYGIARADDLSLAGRMVRNEASEPDAFEAAAR